MSRDGLPPFYPFRAAILDGDVLGYDSDSDDTYRPLWPADPTGRTNGDLLRVRHPATTLAATSGTDDTSNTLFTVTGWAGAEGENYQVFSDGGKNPFPLPLDGENFIDTSKVIGARYEFGGLADGDIITAAKVVATCDGTSMSVAVGLARPNYSLADGWATDDIEGGGTVATVLHIDPLSVDGPEVWAFVAVKNHDDAANCTVVIEQVELTVLRPSARSMAWGPPSSLLGEVTGTGFSPTAMDSLLTGFGLTQSPFDAASNLTGPDLTLVVPDSGRAGNVVYTVGWDGPAQYRDPASGVAREGDMHLAGVRLIMSPEMRAFLTGGAGITVSLWEQAGDPATWSLLDGYRLRENRAPQNDGQGIGQGGKAVGFHEDAERTVLVALDTPLSPGGNPIQVCFTVYWPSPPEGDIVLRCRLEWVWDTPAVEMEVRRILGAADTGGTLLHPEDWLTTEDVVAVSFDAAPALDGTDNFDGFDCSSQMGLVALLGLTDPTQRGVWRIASPGSPPERLPDDQQPGEIQRSITVRYPADRQLSANVGTWVSHDGGLAWAQVERRRVYHVAGIVSAFSSSVLVDIDDGGGTIGVNEVFLATGADEASRVGLRSTFDSGDQDNTYPWGYGDVVGDEAIVVNPGSSLHGTRWRCVVGRPHPEWTLVTASDAGSLLAAIRVDGPLAGGVVPNQLLWVPTGAAITYVRIIVGTPPSGDDLTIIMQERLGGAPIGAPIVITDGNDQPSTSDPLTGGPPVVVASGAFEFDVTNAAGAEDLQLFIFGALI